MTRTDPAVTAHRSNRAAFISQLDRRERVYQAPLPGDCYCGHDIQDHGSSDLDLDMDLCGLCDCSTYTERIEVLATRDALDVDDQFNEGRRRNNTQAAINLTMHRHGRKNR